jgi:3D (Asp-Asp-Asp) domain-containing protein
MRWSFRFPSRLLVLLVVCATVGIAQAPTPLVLKATAYTSSVHETDSTPFITATGARTRIGVIAVSRDMLRTLPYGSKVVLEDLGTPKGLGKGRFNHLFRGRVFIVEDTMNPRKRDRIDVWLPERSTAIRFGVRNVRITILRYGRG